MTKLEFLNDTITYYSENVDRRCVFYNGNSCFYSPSNVGKEKISDGCAIGRHLDNKLKLKLDKIVSNSVWDNKIFGYLPTWMQDLNQDFLYDIQKLHDYSSNWNTKGLTESGKEYVEYIKQRYEL